MVVFLSIVLMYVIGCVIAMFLFAQQVLFRMRINSGYKHLNLLDVLFNGTFWREFKELGKTLEDYAKTN